MLRLIFRCIIYLKNILLDMKEYYGHGLIVESEQFGEKLMFDISLARFFGSYLECHAE